MQIKWLENNIICRHLPLKKFLLILNEICHVEKIMIKKTFKKPTTEPTKKNKNIFTKIKYFLNIKASIFKITFQFLLLVLNVNKKICGSRAVILYYYDNCTIILLCKILRWINWKKFFVEGGKNVMWMFLFKFT